MWKEKLHQEDDDHDGNGDAMIVDATCAPSNIRYPQDASLLNGPGKTQKGYWTSYTIGRRP